MKSSQVYKRLTLASIIFMIIMVILSSNGVFGGRTVEEVSQFPGAILVPAGYTFAIWGPIYIGLLVFGLYQLWGSRQDETTLQSIRPRVITNVIANALWLPAATMSGFIGITVVLIVYMWFSLGMIHRILAKNLNKVSILTTVVPMSMYFAWITMATPLNIASYVNLLGLSAAVTTVPRVIFWIGLGRVTSMVVFWRLRYLSFIAITIWAVTGFIVARMSDNMTLAAIGSILIVISTILIIIRRSQGKLRYQ